MKILVTGGAGFMGSWLVNELIERNYEVITVDNLQGGSKENLNPRSTFMKMDLRNRKKVENITKNVDIIFHLAAYAAEGQSVFAPIEINDINITPMNNLLVAAINNDIEKFIFTSSMAVYGDQEPPFSEDMPRKPVDPYGCGKTYCEQMLEIFHKTYGLRYTIIRPHNVYGPRQNMKDPYRNVLMIWINRIMKGEPPFIYGDGQQKRAFSYIEDITPALANSASIKKTDGEIINLGSNEVVTINQACKIVLDEMKSDLEPIHLEDRPGEVKFAYCTVEKSKILLGYENRHKLREGIEKMVAWANKLGPQKTKYSLPLEIKKKAPKVWVEKII